LISRESSAAGPFSLFNKPKAKSPTAAEERAEEEEKLRSNQATKSNNRQLLL
jgi:hypothetical protein